MNTRYAVWKFAGNFLLNHQRGVMRENLRTQPGSRNFLKGKSSREGVKFTRETFSNVARRRRSSPRRQTPALSTGFWWNPTRFMNYRVASTMESNLIFRLWNFPSRALSLPFRDLFDCNLSSTMNLNVRDDGKNL